MKFTQTLSILLISLCALLTTTESNANTSEQLNTQQAKQITTVQESSACSNKSCPRIMHKATKQKPSNILRIIPYCFYAILVLLIPLSLYMILVPPIPFTFSDKKANK